MSGMLQFALITVLFAQASAFTYSNLGLDTDLVAVERRYPRSTHVGDHIQIAREDVRDFVTGISLSGNGPSRRLRIAFEAQLANGTNSYPRCAEIQRDLERRYGPPQSVRRFNEEASPRSDRIWKNAREQMTLVCFEPARGNTSLRAEAIVIVRR